MPIYEYRCESCGRSEELLQGLSAPGRHACPDCGAPQGMMRQHSIPALAVQESFPASAPASSVTSSCGGGCGCDCPYSGQ